MKKSFILLFLAICLTGCQPIKRDRTYDTSRMWKYSEVRLLDPVDALDPEQDLIALYTRINHQFYQIRIDFLEMDFPINHDIYVLIDTNPGGSDHISTSNNGLIHADIEWDYQIFIPASGNVKVVNSNYYPIYGMELLILRDTVQDNIVLSFNKETISTITNLTKIQILITQPNHNIVVDQTEPTYINTASPSRTKVLFAFWNTFSASTPAETLRSWAGAHSGPMSSRHGLKYLIEAAANSKTPVFLLDLNKPETLSALDYIGVLTWIEDLEKKDVLVMINNKFLSNRLNISKSNWLFNKKKLYVINGVNDYAQFSSMENKCSSISYDINGTPDIPETLLGCKSLLITYGLSGSPNPLIIGGDFNDSYLGDPSVNKILFSYIKNHPWIQVLSKYDLQTNSWNALSWFPTYFAEYSSNINNQTNTLIASNSPLVQTRKVVYSDLLGAPENQLSDLAWQVYMSLSHPRSPELLPLSVNYIGQIGYILAAAKWVEQPVSTITCSIDLDYDGADECLLANNDIFITIEPEGAYMPFVFTKDEYGDHQIIGPTWEFIIGLSDISARDFSQGLMSDPGQILGAFADNINNWEKYNIFVLKDRIIIENKVLPMRKSFIITDEKITVEVQDSSNTMKSPQIPLVLDPWTRYTTGWGNKYISATTSQGIRWEIDTGVSIELSSDNHIYLYPFNATHDEMAYPENPNFDYGRGHYLPYPMALAEIQPTGVYSVDIVIKSRSNP